MSYKDFKRQELQKFWGFRFYNTILKHTTDLPVNKFKGNVMQ